MNYWFFLYPYTFVWSDSEQILLYNSKNKKQKKFVLTSELSDIISKLNDPVQLYCLELSEETVFLPIVHSFLQQVRDSESGDWIEVLPGQKKPVLLPPILKVIRDVKHLKEHSSYGWNDDYSLTYLKKISIFINGECSQGCRCCTSAFRQIPFCTKSKQELAPEKIGNILAQLLGSSLNKICIFGGNYFEYSRQEELCDVLNLFKYPKEIYVHYLNIPIVKERLSLFVGDAFCLNILVSGCADKCRIVLLAKFVQQNKLNVRWTFAITSEEEYLLLEDILLECPLEKLEVKPLIMPENETFICDNVYLDEESIKQSRLSKREIFAHQALNTFAFGEISILSNGDVFANLNEPTLGNIENQSLPFMLYNELLNGNSWFKIRDVQPCTDCIYQWLCPSPSNYERITGKINLCNVK